MPGRILIFILILLFSFHSKGSKTEIVNPSAARDSNTKQTTIQDPDTTSSDYLIQLVESEKPLNYYWTKKLVSLRNILLPYDSYGQLSIVRKWQINDSISVIILKSSGGTYDLEYLLSIKNKHLIISEIKIGDNGDSDLSPENPYFYTEYIISKDRKIKLFNHKVTGTEGSDENDRIISIKTFTIQDNGKIVKK
jgi:hypothetical protein